MKLSTATFILLNTLAVDSAFVPQLLKSSQRVLYGNLDDFSGELYQETIEDSVDETYQADRKKTEMKDVDRYGPGNLQNFVDFEEFDGGDGQMGVAGDGNAQLEKIGRDSSPQLAKSKIMSAKNAWGTATGYADVLREQGVETSRAQQLENWHNQNEVKKKKDATQKMTEGFDQVTNEEDWRTLSSFGVERTQDFSLDEAFGAVTAGEITDTIELKSMIGKIVYKEFQMKNDHIGFSDFRAAFTSDTDKDWTVTPTEGALSKDSVDFVVKFKPNNPGLSKGFLVIETEDMKKTYSLIGSTS